MSFFNGFADEFTVFRTGCGDRLTRENWGIVVQSGSCMDSLSQKRKQRMASVLAKKRARMTRGDEEITDDIAKKAAVDMLDQIQNSPGMISLDFSCPQTAALCPIPAEFREVEVSDWSINRLREGHLKDLLARDPKSFASLKLPKICGGEVDARIPPRRMNAKEALEKLRKGDRSADGYIGFASAVANLMRMMDNESGESLANSIATLVENEAVNTISGLKNVTIN